MIADETGDGEFVGEARIKDGAAVVVAGAKRFHITDHQPFVSERNTFAACRMHRLSSSLPCGL
jgi:endonuclease YncB( thermonuclease family)